MPDTKWTPGPFDAIVIDDGIDPQLIRQLVIGPVGAIGTKLNAKGRKRIRTQIIAVLSMHPLDPPGIDEEDIANGCLLAAPH